MTVIRKLCFRSVNNLANRKVPEIFHAFKNIYMYYLQRGSIITTLHVDGIFAPLKTMIESMPSVLMVNISSINEYVPEIKRRIRVVKERCRDTLHGLPFTQIPNILMMHIVFNFVNMLNYFPTKGGISNTLSPKTIISGETLYYKKYLCLQLGQYCHVHKEDSPRNSLATRTIGAICLGPSGNLQG